MRSSERRDILGELFRGEQGPVSGAGLEELESLIHACLAPKSPAVSERKAVLPLKRKGVSSTKKTTHYLREDIFDGLTQAKQILRRLLPEGTRGRASKSGLVNCAVNALLQEIEEKGLESPMIKSILGKKE